MASSKASKGFYWIAFLISTVVCVWMLIAMPQWFWIMLPFVLTFLVMAMDAV